MLLRGRRNTFATFSEDALHFSWQAQHFGDIRSPMSFLRGRHSTNLSLLKVSKQLVMSVCVAGMALPDTFTCLQTCRKSFRVAGAVRCILRGRCSTLETSDVILRGRRSTLDVSCSLFFANRIVRAASRGDTQRYTLYTLHFTLHPLHFPLHTLHFTLHTLHFTHLYTVHSTLFTLRSTLYTALYTLHYTLYTAQ